MPSQRDPECRRHRTCRAVDADAGNRSRRTRSDRQRRLCDSGGCPTRARSDDTAPETSEPETSDPETSEPVGTTPVDATDDQESDDVNEVVAIVSVLAFVALVSVAAWWMVRRDDQDDPRHQPLNEPLPGQDLV